MGGGGGGHRGGVEGETERGGRRKKEIGLERDNINEEGGVIEE